MSTLAYAELTNKREAAVPRTSTTTAPPGMKTYMDALAALIPAEVLTLHALVLSATTRITGGVARITAPGTLRWAFWGLVALSVALYVAPRLLAGHWDKKRDWFRTAIPPLAFVGWTMLQRTTAFDAVLPTLPEASRTVAALFLAAVLGAVSTLLAIRADHRPATP